MFPKQNQGNPTEDYMVPISKIMRFVHSTNESIGKLTVPLHHDLVKHIYPMNMG